MDYFQARPEYPSTSSRADPRSLRGWGWGSGGAAGVWSSGRSGEPGFHPQEPTPLQREGGLSGGKLSFFFFTLQISISFDIFTTIGLYLPNLKNPKNQQENKHVTLNKLIMHRNKDLPTRIHNTHSIKGSETP